MEENAVYDRPDERDFLYSDLLGAIESIGVPFPTIKIWNQGAKTETRMACTRFALGHIVNAQFKTNMKGEILNLEEFWARYIKEDQDATTRGATLQSALKQAKAEELIGGYFVVKTEAEILDALEKGFFIYTGSSNGDWTNVRNNKEYKLRTDGKIVGHAWVIPAEEKLLNSYGENNGYAILPKELYDTTFTKYAIIPKEDYNIILNYKKEIMSKINIPMAKVGYNLGVWNGLDAEEPASREEVVTMMLRIVQKVEKGEITSAKIEEALKNIVE